DGKSCDLTSSYVQATKTADENFALKVSLKCDKKSDFIVTTIEKKCAVPGNSCKEEIKKDPIVDKLPNSNGGSNSNSSSNNGSNQNSNVTTTVKTTIKITITCPNCNDVTPDPTPDPKPDKVLYYKYVKYGEWLDGYKNGSQYENNCTNTIYYDYCKEHTNTYYTSSYIDAKRANNTKYTYTIKLDNISNYRTKENTVGVSNKSYFSPNLTDYIAYLNTRDENITMIGANQKYNVYPNSIYDFKNSSLDIDNFTFNVSGAYKNGNAYFVDVTINYKNGNGIIPYNAKNIGYNVYFVPLKFNVSYSTNSDCIRDTELNKWKYNGYSVSNPSYETGCHHREIFYKWSTEKSLAGYTYTGISEYR
ncbi:MAG: hypothetical protein RSF67_06880, partial [Clostridia bacterium]